MRYFVALPRSLAALARSAELSQCSLSSLQDALMSRECVYSPQLSRLWVRGWQEEVSKGVNFSKGAKRGENRVCFSVQGQGGVRGWCGSDMMGSTGGLVDLGRVEVMGGAWGCGSSETRSGKRREEKCNRREGKMGSGRWGVTPR